MNGAMKRALTALSIFPFLLATPATAQEPQLIETFGSWSAFVGAEAGKKICYMGSVPKKEKGKYERRGDTFTLVTHRPAEKRFDVVSVEAGYNFKEGSEMMVFIGGQDYSLFTRGAGAWARDTKADRALVGAMSRGLEMVVKGTSMRANLTEDIYSLSGFSAAHAASAKACGVK